MNSISKAVIAAAAFFTLSCAQAQGAGGAGTGAVGGGSGATTQGRSDKSVPNMGAATNHSTVQKSSDMSTSPTRMPQNAPHAKGASDTAASGAQ